MKYLNFCSSGSKFESVTFKFTKNHTPSQFFLFIQKYIYNGHIKNMKKSKSKIYITVIRCKATIAPEIKLKEKQLQN